MDIYVFGPHISVSNLMRGKKKDSSALLVRVRCELLCCKTNLFAPPHSKLQRKVFTSPCTKTCIKFAPNRSGAVWTQVDSKSKGSWLRKLYNIWQCKGGWYERRKGFHMKLTYICYLINRYFVLWSVILSTPPPLLHRKLSPAWSWCYFKER